MITMELLGNIRRMHARDKMSERAIAKRTGLSRNTMHKWLEIPEEVQAPRYVRAEKFGKLTALAVELEQALKADAHRPKQDQRTGKALFAQIKASGYLLEQERTEMMPMPTPFDGYVQREARVSSTCRVSVHRNRYSVPCEFAGQRVSTRLYPTRISVVAGDAVVASHERLSDRGHTSYVAVDLVVESGALSTGHALNVLARLTASPRPETVETTLRLQEPPEANTARYDSLRGELAASQEAPAAVAANAGNLNHEA